MRRSTSVSIVQVIAMVALCRLLDWPCLPRSRRATRTASCLDPIARPSEKAVSETPAPAAPVEEQVDKPEAVPPAPEEPVELASVPEEPPLQLKIIGTVLDASTQQPIEQATITATRKRTGEDKIMLATMDRDARRRARRELRSEHKDASDSSGAFTVDLTEPGVYEILVVARGYVPFAGNSDLLGETVPEYQVEVRLSKGASISGKVTESESNKGAAGVTVTVESTGKPSCVTDGDGRYMVEGLAPGEYGVAVDVTGTPYMVGKELPYKKVTLTSADQKVDNVNFTVDAAGVVWGYVLSPDKAPIPSANVMLSSSESMISQALSTIAKKAAPITDTSGEDGYYELTGVPFNQRASWLPAHAPQLMNFSADRRHATCVLTFFCLRAPTFTAGWKP